MTYEEMKESIGELNGGGGQLFHGFQESVGPRRYEMENGPYFGIYCYSDTLYTGPGPEVWKIYKGGWSNKERETICTGTEESGVFMKFYSLIRAMHLQIQQRDKLKKI